MSQTTTGERSSWPGRAVAVTAMAAVAAGAFLAGEGPVPDDGPGPAEPVDRLGPIASPDRRLPASEWVIGVTAGGRHRAYRVADMSEVRQHIRADWLGGVPLALVYCDQTDCARVFTDSVSAGLPAVGIGGYSAAEGMLVRVGRHRYTQRAGRPVDPGAPPCPYQVTEAERTTWGAWAAAHPDTELAGAGAD